MKIEHKCKHNFLFYFLYIKAKLPNNWLFLVKKTEILFMKKKKDKNKLLEKTPVIVIFCKYSILV